MLKNTGVLRRLSESYKILESCFAIFFLESKYASKGGSKIKSHSSAVTKVIMPSDAKIR